MKNIAVFASGNGSNFQAIAEASIKGMLKAKLKLLVCDSPRAFVLSRAKKFKVKTCLINPRDYLSKKDFDYGVKLTGVTVHFVDEKMDHGPIILQEPLRVRDRESLESLEEKIHKLEHKAYPQALNLFLSGKLKIKGRKVLK